MSDGNAKYDISLASLGLTDVFLVDTMSDVEYSALIGSQSSLDDQ